MFKALISSIVAKHFKRKLTNLTITEDNITEVLKQIRITLLDADVNLLVVKEFIKDIRNEAVGTTIEPHQDAEEVLLTIIKNNLIKILGSKQQDINLDNDVTTIMMVGLQGSGKTTSAGKLAYHTMKKYGKKPLLVALDIYRPAAIEQLQTLAQSINCDFFQKGEQNPVTTAREAMEFAKTNGNNVIIFDTAGRLQTNVELMEELKGIKKVVRPDEILLVVDAMSGQETTNVANEFNNTLDLTGFLISKLDSDARAGAALSLAYLLKKPIKFTGTGEKIDCLDIFYPDRIADRILGLGDVLTLAEKASEVVNEEKANVRFARMLSGKMDFEDLLQQMREITNVGSLSSIAKMLPQGQDISDSHIEAAEKKIKT